MIELLHRHRAGIEEGIRRALDGSTSLLAILRYHAGLQGADGEPEKAMGKLLRPSLVLFTAEQLGATVEAALPPAVALELVHNFSLIHDDIQDCDRTRRGRSTVWTLHGVNEAINAGDLMMAVAIRTALRAGVEATELLLHATEAMIEGQSRDLDFETRLVEVDEYLGMIDRKTGALLRCAFELGACVAGADESVVAALQTLSLGIGRAFQIQDDLLGIWGNGDVFGKPQGSDIRRKKKSFPVAVAFERAENAQRERLASIYEKDEVSEDDVTWVIAAMEDLGVRDEGVRWVREQLNDAREALHALPFSEEGKREMNELIDYLAGREK